MRDLIDYSDYTAEIVRGALLDAHGPMLMALIRANLRKGSQKMRA